MLGFYDTFQLHWATAGCQVDNELEREDNDADIFNWGILSTAPVTVAQNVLDTSNLFSSRIYLLHY